MRWAPPSARGALGAGFLLPDHSWRTSTAAHPHDRESRFAEARQLLHNGGDRAISVGTAYFASIQVSEPASLMATFVKKMCAGLPSAVPRCSVETRSGPAFL